MRRRSGIVITLIAAILLYGGGSVWLGAHWRAEGPVYRKIQERDGDIARERLDKEGRNLISEKQQQAGIEEARILNAARVDAAEILATAKKRAAEIEAIGEKTTDDLFLGPFLSAGGKAAELRRKRDDLADAAKKRRLDLLIMVYETARDEARGAINKVSNGMIQRTIDANRR